MISDISVIARNESEIYTEMLELFDTVPLLGWMISANRPKAKDLPRKDGKIIVDLSKPHIIEDADYFRQAAIAYQQNGVYTNFFPSKSPTSPYRKFWDEEIRRCRYGYVRESDGEWITGYHYFYLNYSPILRTVITGERSEDGTVKADRIADFPDFWDGDYLFFHYCAQAEDSGKYGAVLKARGKGYSYKVASMLARNYFLFKQSKSYALASDSEYLDTDGLMNKVSDIFSFVISHVGFAKKLALVDTVMHKKSGYKKTGMAGEFGFLSEIIGVTLKNDPDKARGKRGKLIAWEEAGSFPYILKSWRIAQKSLEEGGRIFGFMIAFGTGGEEGSNFVGLESLFYRSKAYRVYSMRNVFDKNSDGSKCGFFIPDYLNRADCYDKDGNSDVVKAVYEALLYRKDVKYNTNDATDYAQVKAEGCLTPQEAVMKTEGTIFPVEEIKNRLSEILPNEQHFVGPHYVGELIWSGTNNVEFRPKFNIYPIRDYPYKGNARHGAVEIFELPKYPTGDTKPQWGRYIGGCDPVDDDIGTSLFSVFIMDLYTDTIVAEYTGRQDKADLNFEIALKLAIYYNAEINYENKLKGMFDYFNRMNAVRYLANTPEYLKDMEYVKQIHTIGNKSKGTPPSEQINKQGRRLQSDWMMTKNTYYPEEPFNLSKIRSIGYLKEAAQWRQDGNFDRISAGIMLFILRSDRLKFVKKTDPANTRTRDSYAADPFFADNPVTNIIGELDF